MAFVPRQAHAGHLMFHDIEALSQSGRYKVTAKSPDNADGSRRPFEQSNFVYECTDTQAKKVLWTRKQAMEKPVILRDDLKRPRSQTTEGSPRRICVSDSGHTVVWTGLDELIIVDAEGKQIRKLSVLQDCLSKDENDKYVQFTSVGLLWAEGSLFYIARVESKEHFIIRPWWGRHIFIELANGEIKMATESLNKAARQSETEYVLGVLKAGRDNKKVKCSCGGDPYRAGFAAYLAGVLKIKEAVPALRELENCTDGYSFISRMFSSAPKGRINPFSYAVCTTRQSVHLALRRLGEKPGAFSSTSFKPSNQKDDPQKPYVRKPAPGTRESNTDKVQKGMSPEQVIDLIGYPDFVPGDKWQYDIDAEDPYTLTLSWSNNQTVDEVKNDRPAHWQSVTKRDGELLRHMPKADVILKP